MKGNSYKIVYLKSSFCKIELCKYLLQVKYISSDGREMQNCICLTQDKILHPEKVKISVVYCDSGYELYHIEEISTATLKSLKKYLDSKR